MGCQISGRRLPGAVPDPQQKCGFSIEHSHWVCQSAIPCQVQQILPVRPTRQMECNLVVKYRIHEDTKQGVPK